MIPTGDGEARDWGVLKNVIARGGKLGNTAMLEMSS
jgi:hypothetical protein